MNGQSSLARSGSCGFSLVELLVTLAILGLLLGMAAPSLANLIRDSRLATHADLLLDSLNSARLEAVRQGRDFTVCPARAPNTAVACTEDAVDWDNGWIVITADGDVVQRIAAKAGITVDATASAVTFRSTLGTSTAAASFSLCASERVRQQVDLTLSGHVGKRLNGALPCP